MKLVGTVTQIKSIIDAMSRAIPRDMMVEQVIIDCGDCSLCRADQDINNEIRLDYCEYADDVNLPTCMLDEPLTDEMVDKIVWKYNCIYDRLMSL